MTNVFAYSLGFASELTLLKVLGKNLLLISCASLILTPQFIV